MSNLGIKNIWKETNSGGSVDTSNLVTTNTSQTITAPKQFNGAVQFENVLTVHNTTTQDNSLALYRENTKANFISFFNGTQRQGFFGKASASDTNITVKAETGDLVLDCVDTNHSINASNKNISAVKDPTAAQHAATKSYVDAVTGPFTKIYETGHFSGLTDAFTQKLDYTNMQNNYRISDSSVYEVLFKQNSDSKDVYTSCIIGVNSANYDNCGTTNIMPWSGSGVDSIEFSITLKNNQFKLFARRGRGTNTTTTNWNVNTIIYIRKIASGSMV